MDKNGRPFIINSLQELAISYCGGCDSDINRRIHSLFPNLRTFRHIKEGRGDCFWGCEERLNTEGVSFKEFLVCNRGRK